MSYMKTVFEIKSFSMNLHIIQQPRTHTGMCLCVFVWRLPSLPFSSTPKNQKPYLSRVTQRSTANHTQRHTHTLKQTTVWPVLSAPMSPDKACMLFQSVLKHNDRQGHAALVYRGARVKEAHKVKN